MGSRVAKGGLRELQKRIYFPPDHLRSPDRFLLGSGHGTNTLKQREWKWLEPRGLTLLWTAWRGMLWYNIVWLGMVEYKSWVSPPQKQKIKTILDSTKAWREHTTHETDSAIQPERGKQTETKHDTFLHVARKAQGGGGP